MGEIGKRAVGIVIRDDKILLICRYHPEWHEGWYYVFPGGGVEKDETVEEAVIREIKEELSVDAEIDKFLFTHYNPAKVWNYNGRDEYFYLIKDFKGEPELSGPEKERMNEDDQFYLEWIPIADIKNMKNLFPEVAKNKIVELFDSNNKKSYS